MSTRALRLLRALRIASAVLAVVAPLVALVWWLSTPPSPYQKCYNEVRLQAQRDFTRYTPPALGGAEGGPPGLADAWAQETCAGLPS